MPLTIILAHHRSVNTTMTVQAELEAELAKKKARAARFSLPVKTTAEEVCSAAVAPACVHAALDAAGSLNTQMRTRVLLSLLRLSMTAHGGGE